MPFEHALVSLDGGRRLSAAENPPFGRITTGNGQIAPAVPRVALREAEPSSKPIAITGSRP
jgi:hypothetical protein